MPIARGRGTTAAWEEAGGICQRRRPVEGRASGRERVIGCRIPISAFCFLLFPRSLSLARFGHVVRCLWSVVSFARAARTFCFQLSAFQIFLQRKNQPAPGEKRPVRR